MARGSAGESVLQKHLRVLEAFDAWHPFRTLADISAATGLAPSTTHRLAAELEREGLLERMPDLSYRLGVRLWEFAARTPGALGLREVARPWLGAVHERVRQHAQLAVLSHHDALFIERMSARDAVVSATVIGGRLPLHASSAGIVLLAHAPAALLDDVVAGGLRTFTPDTVRTGTDLRARIRRARADGFAVADGQIHEGSRGIAVPVFGPHGTVYAALGVVVPRDDASPQPHAELLIRAAAGVTRSLEEAYLPDGGGTEHGALGSRALAGLSRPSAEWFASLRPELH